jgi:hypothetical protein
MRFTHHGARVAEAACRPIVADPVFACPAGLRKASRYPPLTANSGTRAAALGCAAGGRMSASGTGRSTP